MKNLQIRSLMFSVNFDKLGLTDNQNPYGVLPPLLARSMGRMSGNLIADYVAKILDRRRQTRSAAPPPPQPAHANFHGGERALLYTVVEDFLSNFGMDGKSCLLRAICEVHGQPLHHYGFLGEILKLFFTLVSLMIFSTTTIIKTSVLYSRASKSPFAEILEEYVAAERTGQGDGECWPYYKDCPKSLFMASNNKYSEDAAHKDEEQENENEIDSRTSKVTLDSSELNTQFM
uniref:Uncharacterized protein n=1 Tax=Timema douglasi TaxID=61478 RepID=A0A7R8VJ52_TIMDO|nr:unnamed protein product [Timema douglasi]